MQPLTVGTASDSSDADQRVILHGISWDAYEALLLALGDTPGIRVSYLDGEMQLVGPSKTHEKLKKRWGALIEVFVEETGGVVDGYGSMTLKKERKLAGAEADECYAVGGEKEWPDLALEVVWTSGGVDKLEIYRRLGVREVWFWIEGVITVHVLGPSGFRASKTSKLLPGIDLGHLARFLQRSGPQTELVRAYRAELAAGRGKTKPRRRAKATH
ncbi:MAG: Uma2 family endonuclease [Deltaproteobacteria bacterium]|nr:Uma2 family endonuclease [Deltaproteobacteria bacterium]